MNILKPASQVPVRNECDVLVIGAGPAGFGAAITAARAGARVTLVEYGGVLGGMWTLGILSPFFDNRFHDGLNRELREILQGRNQWGGLWNISFNPTEMAFILDELAADAGVDVLLYTMGTEPIVEDNCLKGVYVTNKSGQQAILAKVVIDCTGDGDIAARAGVPFALGRPEDGAMQPMTMMFKIGGVKPDYPRDDTLLWYKEICRHVNEDDMLQDVPFNHPAIIKLPKPDEALIQWTHIKNLKGTNGDQLSQATLLGRRMVKKAMQYLHYAREVLGDVYLLELPSVIGVRETRRIQGDYTISDDDVKNGASFKDGICRVHFGVDIHEPVSRKQTCFGHPGFDIPLRSMIPVGIEHLMTAGRCISGSFIAHAAYRVTGDCLAMGEAAGKHAVEAINAAITVRALAKSKADC